MVSYRIKAIERKFVDVFIRMIQCSSLGMDKDVTNSLTINERWLDTVSLQYEELCRVSSNEF